MQALFCIVINPAFVHRPAISDNVIRKITSRFFIFKKSLIVHGFLPFSPLPGLSDVIVLPVVLVADLAARLQCAPALVHAVNSNPFSSLAVREEARLPALIICVSPCNGIFPVCGYAVLRVNFIPFQFHCPSPSSLPAAGAVSLLLTQPLRRASDTFYSIVRRRVLAYAPAQRLCARSCL